MNDEEFKHLAYLFGIAAYTFTNKRLLLLSKIGEPYDPKKRSGVIGRNFNGQFNIAFLGAQGFFKDKKFNLYMGAGALGGAMSDFASDNFDHKDVEIGRAHV